jgi:ADP-ribose pyrophosphatase YjhB (NUDIX family)
LNTTNPQWLDWVRRLQSIAQNGLAYTKDPYDQERFEMLRQVAAEIAATHTHMSFAFIKGLFEGEHGHATPKVDVRGVMFRGDKILLVREASDGGWTLPGGWADIGDSPKTAVEKEILEESGFEATAVKLIAFYDRDKQGHPPHPFHIYKAIFLCELVGGEAKTNLETSEVAFFSRDAIPENLSFSRVTHIQIQHFFDHHKNPDWPTEFD